MRSGGNLELRSGGGLGLNAGNALTAKGATATFEGVATATLKAPFVQINGAGCKPAARLGDAITGTGGGAAPVTGTVLAGSSSVCIG